MIMNEVKIALAGNPNSGKTTIFNALTGARQKVGNYPGVTVERKEGFLKIKGLTIRVIDLPGTYSLTSYSPEEVVARRVIVEERPAVVVDVVDASNLERNLYLTMQLFELGVPVIVVLNMMDDARKKGLTIELEALKRKLGVPVVPTVGHKGAGLKELKQTIEEVIQGRLSAQPNGILPYPDELWAAVRELETFVRENARDLSG
jgi:ferrous iron transport protein B